MSVRRGRRKMGELRLWISLLIQSILLCAVSAKHHRRSMGSHSHLPVSKSGWRPVVGSSGLVYSALGTAPLHAPYKIPIHDYYQSTGRPVAARDVTKLSSIAQSYRPTTLRTVPISSLNPAQNQPINSYLNPFSLPNNGLQYKFVHQGNVFRQTHNPYLNRPIYDQKVPTKKQQQQYHNNILQTLTSVQPIHFGQYSTPTPLDILGNSVQGYARPDSKKPQSAGTEIYKQELYKLQDNDAAPQSVSQQVKTAQQQTIGSLNIPTNPYYQYSLQDLAGIQQLPPSIIGTFGSFGVQSVKNREPAYPTTKQPQQPHPTKQTLFNSFNVQNNFKNTPTVFSTSTPKLQATQNQFYFSSTFNDLANAVTPRIKPVAPTKIDPNAGKKNGFKPSPHDPFNKQQQHFEFNKITTYNPLATPVPQFTTAANPYYDYNFNLHSAQQNFNQHNGKYNINNQQIYDNIGLNQQVSQQFINAPGSSNILNSVNSASYRPTYEVTDNEADDVTQAAAGGWLQDPYDTNHKTNSEETLSKPEHTNALFTNPTTIVPEHEEYSIVTEPEKPYEQEYNYDSQVESQSRRPLGDDFEPIGQHKLKDYYYKVSTPSTRRTKKPKIPQEPSTEATPISEEPIEALPTLPPTQHFRRPTPPTSESGDKDKVRKRNKIRRRRPIGSRIKDESTTVRTTTTNTDAPQTTEEIHTVRPRIRPLKLRTESPLTTVSATTDLTTSALPTISPTTPTIMKKKLSHQRFLTTTSGKVETTTQAIRDYDQSKESSIMKISNRSQASKQSHEYRSSEVPDYSHKQDEKDTPTSDIAVSLTDTYKNSPDILKEFSFHRDVRPVEITTVNSIRESSEVETTTTPRPETTRNVGKIQRPKLKIKHDRPKFSVKDYRNRLSSTTSSTEQPTESTPKARPQRKNPYSEINTDIETTTERKRFTPKEPRHKLNRTENNEQEIHSRLNNRQRQTTEATESTTQKISARLRNGQRRPKPTDETIETSSTIAGKRPLRKKVKDSETGESVQDVSISEATSVSEKNDITSERTRSESAIMKIADKKHHDHIERLFEHSKRVSDLTLAASKDYNTPGVFKTVSSNSRRIPNYFTIATDDPILPIEAFFPQLNQKKES